MKKLLALITIIFTTHLIQAAQTKVKTSHRVTFQPDLVLQWRDNNLYNLDNELTQAVHSNNIAQVESLLKQKANPNAASVELNYPMLLDAVLNKSLPIVQLLLEYGANVNITNELGESALDLAIQKKNAPLVKILVTAGAELPLTDEKYLHKKALQIARKNPEIQTAIEEGEKERKLIKDTIASHLLPELSDIVLDY